MAKEIMLEAQLREESGSSAARRLRREGWLPAVVCGRDGESRLLKLKSHDFELMLTHHVGEHLLADMRVAEADSIKVLLKDVQHDPISDSALHAEFAEVSMTEKLQVSIPLTVTGEAVGVIEAGGILDQPVRELEVECLAGDLVEEIEVDVSALNIGDSILVGDLQVDEKLTVLTDRDVAVASVAMPRVEEEEEEAAEEGEEGAEPEVIGEAEKEAEGEAEDSGEREEK